MKYYLSWPWILSSVSFDHQVFPHYWTFLPPHTLLQLPPSFFPFVPPFTEKKLQKQSILSSSTCISLILCCKDNSDLPVISLLGSSGFSSHWPSLAFAQQRSFPHWHTLISSYWAISLWFPSSLFSHSLRLLWFSITLNNHDMVVFLRDPGFLLYLHNPLGNIIQPYGFIYCLYFVDSQMFTPDMCSELHSFISPHLPAMA